jgi:glutamate synthase (NADPH/NADH) small chain
VVIAIGNNPNPLIPQSMPDLATSKWGTIVVDEATMATSVTGVFAAGDIVSGAATVISAMGQGRIAAQSIHKHLLNGKAMEES